MLYEVITGTSEGFVLVFEAVLQGADADVKALGHPLDGDLLFADLFEDHVLDRNNFV